MVNGAVDHHRRGEDVEGNTGRGVDKIASGQDSERDGASGI